MSREDLKNMGSLQQEGSLNLFIYRAIIAGLQSETKTIPQSIIESYMQYENPAGEEPYYSIVTTDFSPDDVVKVVMKNFAMKLAQASRIGETEASPNASGFSAQIKIKGMALATEALNTNYYISMFKIKRALRNAKVGKETQKQVYMFPFFSPEGIGKARPEQFTTLKDRRNAIKKAFWQTFNPILEKKQDSDSLFLVPVFSGALINSLFFNTETKWTHLGLREGFPRVGEATKENRKPTKAQLRYATYRWSGLQMSFSEDDKDTYWNLSIDWNRLPKYAAKIDKMYNFWENFANIVATRDFRREMYDNLQEVLKNLKPKKKKPKNKAKEDNIEVEKSTDGIKVAVANNYNDDIREIIDMLVNKDYKALDNIRYDNRDYVMGILSLLHDDPNYTKLVEDYGDTIVEIDE